MFSEKSFSKNWSLSNTVKDLLSNTVKDLLSNNVKDLQAIRFATLLKKDPRTGVSEPAVCKSSTK